MASAAREELIGMKVKVVNSKNKYSIGMEGTIVDETQNTLTISTSRGKKRLLKEQVTIEVTNNGKTAMPGNLLLKRPEDRIRMKIGER